MKYDSPRKCKCGAELWTSKAEKHHKCRFTLQEPPKAPATLRSPKTL